MKISTKGRYGLRAMVDIALNSAGDYIPLKVIAERQGISENYLEQVFSTLRKSDLVKSIRGSQGGYSLSKPASKTTVGEVLRALEGELTITSDDSAAPGFNKSVEDCIKLKVWQQVNKSINDVVDSITLEDIVDQYKKLNDDYVLDFTI
ncbi:Rrf2 family transcriptional regulator [Clostridium sp. 19966]|uniref:RrF2 family transcriptional regulator n=1 Tax=Clostridium sp. 19966 TaxID=2768166 RepID=UPI0028DFCBD8|nr:Rrf2 family transcriptional regulator [Clostridium sp. 19966]MDT8717311.1 Rrf2 family transcriptional regulator [Clostridium sp. 19966]